MELTVILNEENFPISRGTEGLSILYGCGSK